MKKIVRQQNYLKDLIESQENQVISKQALRCIIRAVLEPLPDISEEGAVLHRIFDKSGILGLLKRIDFSGIDVHDFSDDSDVLKEKVWANTEFLCVLTHRFGVVLIWDSKTSSPHYVRYYSVWNSKLQNEALDIIGRNTSINIKELQEKFRPDRRDNQLMNNSIRQLIENMDDASKDAVLGFAQIQSEKESEEINQNTRQIAHEIRNQLSICDLYTEILKKYCMKNDIKDEKFLNALNCITKSVKLSGNLLISLKSSAKNDIKQLKLKELIESVRDLTKVYFEGKNIECIFENVADIKIPADENRFLAVLINIIKNGVEAFGDRMEKVTDVLETVSKEKKSFSPNYIKITTEEDENFCIIKISNNAGKIENVSKIFEEGYTTKKDGNGLGLVTAKKYIEEMFGELKIGHNDNDFTEFVIKIAKIN